MHIITLITDISTYTLIHVYIRSINRSTHLKLYATIGISSDFDYLNHNILIDRINELRIEGSSLSWFTSFLNDVTYSVKVNDYISPAIELLCGVPQGSVLGPLLFSIYLRPLSNIISKFPNITYYIYAYDIQLIIKITVNFNLKIIKCASEIINYFLKIIF